MKKNILFLIIALMISVSFPQDYRFPGDINNDGSIDVLDIVQLVGFIISGIQPTLEEYAASDLNYDNSLNVLDVVSLVGLIISPPVCPDGYYNCDGIAYQCCDTSHPEPNSLCETCHILEYFYTETPPHLEQFYSHTDCNRCHTVTSWLDMTFNHTVLDTSCNICHLSDLQVANQSVQLHNTLSNFCLNCHTTYQWSDIVFQHEETGFELEGSHQTVDCLTCHDSSWLGVTSNCSGCHHDEWLATLQPVHTQQVYLEQDCEDCHTADSWSPSVFEHQMPYQAPCSSCHIANYNEVNQVVPDHNGFSTECTNCHESTLWTDIIFDHDLSGFPLEGSHNNGNCISCHLDGYANLPLLCGGCHHDNWLDTIQPVHEAQTYLAEDCEICHNAVEWATSIFEHDLPNQAACNTCHNADFEIAGTTVAGHDTFPTDCTACHQSTYWTETIFDHNATNFPLTDSHDGPECIACHVDNNYVDTPLFCDGCHHDNWIETTQPNHEAQTYLAVECETCHTAIEWTTSIFEHDLPNQAACNTCHNADFEIAGTTVAGHDTFPTDCTACHQS
ncbi:MAG: hypothetical protein HQ510_09815, partial [Candidatus Marinimicrobia bacterium]|nr:hypothetical protein [Candidatus Neomarinimicrobiota bacterium]